MKRTRLRSSLAVVVSLLGLCALAAQCGVARWKQPLNPLLNMDWFDLDTRRYLDLGPDAPWIQAGADGQWDTADDVYRPEIFGDVDLVVRTGMLDFVGAIPPPSPLVGGGSVPVGVAEPLGQGLSIDFVVVATDGSVVPMYGNPVVPGILEGLPVLVVAFADLDGDGFVGVTELDGDPTDAEIEEAELEPVGRRFAVINAGRASGSLAIEAGGPADAPTRVALTAAAWAGPIDPSYFGGNVPSGPALMTHLPFIPRTNPNDILPGGATHTPLPTSPTDLVGVEVEDAFTPDPAAPYGEVFTLRLDGSLTSIDMASLRSGAFARFGFALEPNAATYESLISRPIRRGLDAAGQPVSYEVLGALTIPDDGTLSQQIVRVVALDRMGNITDLDSPTVVEIATEGVVRIVTPDLDGDPHAETLIISDTRGAEIVLDDSGGPLDDGNFDALWAEGGGGLQRIEVDLPDPAI